MLYELAKQMNLEPAHAVILPSAIDSMSRKLHLTRGECIEHCRSNEPLRRYIAQICKTVSEQIAAE